MGQETRIESRSSISSAGLIFIVVVGLMLALVGLFSSASLIVVFVYGSLAAAIVVGAAGIGVSLLKLICPDATDRGWILLGGAGLGLGFYSLLMLGLGSAGTLGRSVWLGLMAI